MSDFIMVKVLPAALIVGIVLWRAEMNWRYRRSLRRYFDKDREADKAAREAEKLLRSGVRRNDSEFQNAVHLWQTLRDEAISLKPWN